MPTDINGVDYY